MPHTPPEQTVCLIAVSGGSGSGKSTLSEAIACVLGDELCVVLGEDNYYKTREENGIVGMPAAEVEATINFDDVSSKDMEMMYRDIAALKRGETIEEDYYAGLLHLEQSRRYFLPRSVITFPFSGLILSFHVMRAGHRGDGKSTITTYDFSNMQRTVDTAGSSNYGR